MKNLQIQETVYDGPCIFNTEGCCPVDSLITHVIFDRKYRDDFAYHWFGRIQGVHKSRTVVNKLLARKKPQYIAAPGETNQRFKR